MRRLSLLAVLLAGPAFAQAPPFAKTAAPFIDEHTLVVVRVDVSKADVETVLKLAAPLLGDVEESSETVKAVKAWVKEFVRVGGSDVFLTYGAADFPNPPCLMAPAPPTAAGQRDLTKLLLAAFAGAGKTADGVVLHGCVCAGTKDALAVLKARKPVDRPDLAAAIEAGKDGVAQVAFAPSAEARKIHEQVAPTLPAELGGGSIQKLTRGLKWMALTVGPGPKMPAKLIAEAASAEAARDLIALEERAHLAGLAQLLKADGETNEGFARRVQGVLDRRKTSVQDNRVVTEWDLAHAIQEAARLPEGTPAERARSANNLKQLMLALHNYHDVNGRFPADVRDKDGKPLLSWRVQILPYIEQEALYKEFKLDEPWDSEHNIKLIPRMPKVLRGPRQLDGRKDRTAYLAPLGKGLLWDDPKGVMMSAITDGTSNTIALVEADDDRAVTWTRPEDLTIDPKDPAARLLGHYGDGFQAAMADGSVRFFKKGDDPKVLWAWFTPAGGEPIEPPK